MKFIKSIAITLFSLLLITACNSTLNVGNPTEEETGVYLRINNDIDHANMFHKTKYKDTDQDTYVLGYMTFNNGDVISVFTRNRGDFGYQDICEDQINFQNGFDEKDKFIEVYTSRKVGIEFNRNGDRKIRFNFINDPYFDYLEDLVEGKETKVSINNGEEEKDFNIINKYTKGSDEYKELTWFMKNPYIHNCDENLLYLQENEDIEYLFTSFDCEGADAATFESVLGIVRIYDDNVINLTDRCTFNGLFFVLRAPGNHTITMKYFPLTNMLFLDAHEN